MAEIQGAWQNYLHPKSNYKIDMANLEPTGPKSYSQFTSHMKCGFRFAADKVWKFEVPPDTPGPALIRGNELHDSVENFFNGSNLLHPDLTFYKQWMWQLREEYDCFPEQKWAFRIEPDDTWTAVPFDDPTASWRGLFDLRLVPKDKEDDDRDVMEWKSGRIYDEHKWQRRLYHIASEEYDKSPGEHNVSTVYFDQKSTRPSRYVTRLDSKAGSGANLTARQTWRHKMNFMDCPDTYIPNPGPHCRWCPHSRFKGGKCKVG